MSQVDEEADVADLAKVGEVNGYTMPFVDPRTKTGERDLLFGQQCLVPEGKSIGDITARGGTCPLRRKS